MRKTNLLLFSILALSIFAFPMVLAGQDVFTRVIGNNTHLDFNTTTSQLTSNPGIGDNITYVTHVTISPLGASGTVNLSSFYYHLPDNSSVGLATDFTLRFVNATMLVQNATTFVQGNYDYVNFTGLSKHFNVTANQSTFNITWKMSGPIAQTTLTNSLVGRAYTETWNITSSATNLSITNASLNMTPSYWYTRIGNPTTVTFNGTSKNYLSTYENLVVYTNLTIGTNMVEYGSGWGTLSITYNGPTIDASSGSSASSSLSVTPQETAKIALGYLLYVIVALLTIGIIVFLVIVLRR